MVFKPILAFLYLFYHAKLDFTLIFPSEPWLSTAKSPLLATPQILHFRRAPVDVSAYLSAFMVGEGLGRAFSSRSCPLKQAALPSDIRAAQVALVPGAVPIRLVLLQLALGMSSLCRAGLLG